MSFTYERDPRTIYRRSFEIIRAEAELGGASPAMTRVLVRMIHACGQVDLPQYVHSSPGAAEIGESALRRGATVLCDSQMLAAGVTRKRLPIGNDVICTLNDSRAEALSKSMNTTRSAAGVELWRERLADAVVAIANAPTALFHLLEIIAGGAPRPALVLGFPVGFVGAAESKRALAENSACVPFITIHGRRGGSAIAAAAINALATEEE